MSNFVCIYYIISCCVNFGLDWNIFKYLVCFDWIEGKWGEMIVKVYFYDIIGDLDEFMVLEKFWF